MDLTGGPVRGRREKDPEGFGLCDPAHELAGELDSGPVLSRKSAEDWWAEAAVPDPAFSLKGLDSGLM